MNYRIALLLACVPASAVGQTPVPAPAHAIAPKEELVPVAIDTSLGRIVIGVDRGRAPITTANFLHYVDTHRLDGETFDRAMQSAGGGLIQGASAATSASSFPDPRTRGPTRQAFTMSPVRSPWRDWRRDPSRADFFILVDDIPAFDAGGPGGDADGFAAFGHVLEGMDVVKKIYDAPVSPTKGEGPMKGQMLEPPVKIIKAERVK